MSCVIKNIRRMQVFPLEIIFMLCKLISTIPHTSPVHWLTATHLFFLLSITFPLGHSQRATHCRVQIGEGLVQFGGQAEPHLVKSWPSTGHSEILWKECTHPNLKLTIFHHVKGKGEGSIMKWTAWSYREAWKQDWCIVSYINCSHYILLDGRII